MGPLFHVITVDTVGDKKEASFRRGEASKSPFCGVGNGHTGEAVLPCPSELTYFGNRVFFRERTRFAVCALFHPC